MSMKESNLTPLASIIIICVLVAGLVIFARTAPVPTPVAAAQPSAQPANQPAAPKAVNIRPVSSSDHRYGSPTASLFLIEYSDFECPFCASIYPTLKKIVDESNGQIAWVYREFPLTSIHNEAGPAANAAECVAEQKGDTGFWRFADTIFANQANLSDTYISTVAKSAGVDMTKFTNCLTTKKYQSKIDADTAESIASGGNGTPFTVVVNTKTGKATPVSGALPYDQIMSIVNAAK